MAKVQTTFLGLFKSTAGTDIPTRTEANADADSVESFAVATDGRLDALEVSDGAANVATRRTLGVQPTQAAPGDLGMSVVGSIPYLSGLGRLSLAPGATGTMLMSAGTTNVPVYVEGVRVVRHGTNAGTARPAAGVVYWIGTATPSNFQSGDFWNDAP